MVPRPKRGVATTSLRPPIERGAFGARESSDRHVRVDDCAVAGLVAVQITGRARERVHTPDELEDPRDIRLCFRKRWNTAVPRHRLRARVVSGERERDVAAVAIEQAA